MSTVIIFETHSITEDNERGIATGWLPGRLSAAGREMALGLGERRRGVNLSAVFTPDLHRATETAELAFGSTGAPPILHDWRLRECDYGELNGGFRDDVHTNRRQWLDEPFPGGECWRQAVHRVERFLADVPLRWADTTILIIGHLATRWGLDCALGGAAVETLIDDEFIWQEGWEYRLD